MSKVSFSERLLVLYVRLLNYKIGASLEPTCLRVSCDHSSHVSL